MRTGTIDLKNHGKDRKKGFGMVPLGLYAGTHFLVDFGCALLIIGKICPYRDSISVLLFYNLFAFAVQMPVGLLADRWGHCRIFAAVGCLLVMTGWMLPTGIVAAVIAGLGNAFFHVGGGLYALNDKRNQAGPLGLFVSPGAFGVYLGSRMAYEGWTISICLLLFLAGIGIVIFGKGEENAPLALPAGNRILLGSTACLFFVVVLRSFLGLAADLPWKAEWGFGAVCAVALGKAAGGCLADRFGKMTVALCSLGMAAGCFIKGNIPAAGLTALFLFNMTMPLTLWAMAELFPGAKAFSFGLLTFALFLGFLPVYFGCGRLGITALVLGTLISLPLLAAGLYGTEKILHTDSVPE